MGVIGGVCGGGDYDAVFSWVFTEDNIKDAGGLTVGGQLEASWTYGGASIVLESCIYFYLTHNFNYYNMHTI